MCSCQTQLRFLPVPSKTVFNLASLLPAHNNVRLADASELPPTWFYNCAVLEDVLTGHYSSFILQQAKDAPNTPLAGNLIRVGDDSLPHSQHWITAGQLDPHFDGFLASLLLAILVQQGRITPLLSPWQIFLVFLDFLGMVS